MCTLCVCSYITDVWLPQLNCLPHTAIVSLNEFNRALFEKVRTHSAGLSLGLYTWGKVEWCYVACHNILLFTNVNIWTCLSLLIIPGYIVEEGMFVSFLLLHCTAIWSPITMQIFTARFATLLLYSACMLFLIFVELKWHLFVWNHQVARPMVWPVLHWIQFQLIWLLSVFWTTSMRLDEPCIWVKKSVCCVYVH